MKMQFVLGFLTAMFLVILGIPCLLKRWKKQKDELTEYYSRFVNLVEDTKDSFYYLQVYPDEKFLYLSPSTDNVMGLGAAKEAYMNHNIIFRDIHPEDYQTLLHKVRGNFDYSKSIVQRFKGKDGKYHWFEEYATPIYKDERLVAIQGVMRNIDEKITLQEKLIYQLNHDKLTDIYNRQYFELKNDEYNEKLNIPISVIVCDLDNLKFVNDTYGHKAGDELIKITAQLLNEFSSDSVTVARIGGDEFVVMMSNTDKGQTERLANQIVDLIKNYNKKSSTQINLSLGYAFTQNSFGNMTELYAEADKKMYKNKQERKQLVKISVMNHKLEGTNS